MFLGVDTVALIYFLEADPVFGERAAAVFAEIDAGRLLACASFVALTEITVKPLKNGDAALTQAHTDFLLNGPLALMIVGHSVAQRAAELRARYNLKTIDALHVATALEAGCDAFLTNDDGLQRLNEISILLLSELEL